MLDTQSSGDDRTEAACLRDPNYDCTAQIAAQCLT